jgi:DNA-binding transcriptional ArsR family regulator
MIADPVRAAMLTALVGGEALPAGELARIAGTSAQSASMHLTQLLEGGLLTVAKAGRHRYYRIARPEVARAIEALGAISTSQRYTRSRADESLCYARTCYDHLAGELAVELAAAFQRSDFLRTINEKDYELTSRGEHFFRSWNIDAAKLRGSRRSFARRCLDWTERRDHLGGALGAAVCGKMFELRWITRDRHSRAVHVSLAGRQKLEQFLQLRRG